MKKSSNIKVYLNGKELKRGSEFRFYKKKGKIKINKKLKLRKNNSWRIVYTSNF